MQKVVLVLLVSLVYVTQQRLQQVVSVFRHGARFAINNYYDGNETLMMKGELTAVGMRQHETFGKILRKQYIETYQFLSNEYMQGQIEVYSTQYNRTIASARSHLFGLYPLGKGPKLINVPMDYLIPPYSNKTNAQQPIFALPLGYLPLTIKIDDKVIMTDCLNWDKLIQQNINEQRIIYDEMMITYLPFLKRIAFIFNLPLSSMNFTKLASLYDTLTVDKSLGRPMPTTFAEQDYSTMRHLHNWLNFFQIKFNLSKAINTPRFTKILHEFDDRISNRQKKLKWTILSAHDTDIVQISNDLNFSSDACIEQLYRKGRTDALNCEVGQQYASNFIFELHSDSQQAFYVKIKHQGKYLYLCERKETSCPYPEWKERVKNILVDYQQICFKQTAKMNPVDERQQKDDSYI